MERPRQVVYDSEDSEDDFSAVGPSRLRAPASCPSSPPTPAAGLPAATPTPPTDVSDNQDGLPDLWEVPFSPPGAAAPAKTRELPRKKERNKDSGTSRKRKRLDAEGADDRVPGRMSTTSHILEIAIPMDSLPPGKKLQQHKDHEHDELATVTTPPRRGRPAATAAQLLSSPDVIAEPGVRQPLPRPPPVPPPAVLVPARDVADMGYEREDDVAAGEDEKEPVKKTKRRRQPNQPRRDDSISEDDELLLDDHEDEEEKKEQVEKEKEASLLVVQPPEKAMVTEPPTGEATANSGNTKTKRPRGRPRKQKEAEVKTSTAAAAATTDAIYETATPSIVEQSAVPAAAETASAAANSGSEGGSRSSDANTEKAEDHAVVPAESKTAQPAGQPQRAASLALGGSSQGRVPFRVGLSKKLRIAPLLKSLKK